MIFFQHLDNKYNFKKGEEKMKNTYQLRSKSVNKTCVRVGVHHYQTRFRQENYKEVN